MAHFDTAFPLKIYLNLNKHDERRRQTENELLDAGIEDYRRLPAYSGKWFRHARGFPTLNRYAQALTHKRGVWTGWRKKAAAVLIFEDDVLLAPGVRERFEALELPDDWAIFYLGCQHRERPAIVAPGLVRCRMTYDMHAYAIRATAYRDVARILTPYGKGHPRAQTVSLHTCDEQLSLLNARLPVYAAYPNLAWQRLEVSEAQENWVTDNYTPEGRQTRYLEAVEGLDAEMAERFGGYGRRSIAGPRSSRPAVSALNFGGRMAATIPEALGQLVGLLTLAGLQGRHLRLRWPQHDAVLDPCGYEAVTDERDWQRLRLLAEARVEQGDAPMTPAETEKQVRLRSLIPDTVTTEHLDLQWQRSARMLRPSRAVLAKLDALWQQWGAAARPVGFVVPAQGTASASEWTEALKTAAGSAKGGSIFLFTDNPKDADYWKSQLTGEELPVFSTDDLFAHTPATRKPDVEAATALLFLSRCEKIVSLPDSLPARLASAIGGAEWRSVNV